MRSGTPKLLHPVRPADDRLAGRGRARGRGRQVVVVDDPERPLDGARSTASTVAVQEQPRGTADAVGGRRRDRRTRTVIVLNGDVPLVGAGDDPWAAQAHEHAGAAATIVTAVLEDPTGYGRVVRAPDGKVERVVETKAAGDATELELQIREVNTGIYAFDGGGAARRAREVRTNNAQGELYLPDVVPSSRPERPWPRTRSPTRPRCSASTTASQLADVRAWRSGESTSATCSPASRSSTPRRPRSTPV